MLESSHIVTSVTATDLASRSAVQTLSSGAKCGQPTGGSQAITGAAEQPYDSWSWPSGPW